MKNHILKISLLVVSIFSVSLFASIELEKAQKDLLETLPPDQRSSVEAKMKSSNKLESDLEEIFSGKPSMIEKPKKVKRIL